MLRVSPVVGESLDLLSFHEWINDLFTLKVVCCKLRKLGILIDSILVQQLDKGQESSVTQEPHEKGYYKACFPIPSALPAVYG